MKFLSIFNISKVKAGGLEQIGDLEFVRRLAR